ncbi:hypothetical protein LLG95_13050 [bacterium]|nr:hypothetical protein [bacterium]
MSETPAKSPWCLVRRIALFLFILFALAILAGLAFLKTRPVPSPESVADATRKYAMIRPLFSGREAEPNAAPAPTSATLAMQADCDRLALEIVNTKYENASRDRMIVSGHITPRIMVNLDRAKALAAYYDKGLKISPEARRELERNFGGYSVAYIARAMIYDIRPDDTQDSIEAGRKYYKTLDQLDPAARAQMLGRIVQALKLMRVVDTPIPGMGLGGCFRKSNDSWQIEAQPSLAPELMNLDLDLLAPRKPLDWDHCTALELDRVHEKTLSLQRLLNAPDAFRFFDSMSADEYPATWYKPFQIKAIAIGGAIAGPAMFIAPQLKFQLIAEDAVQQYAAMKAGNNIDPSKIDFDTAANIGNGNEQIASRILAGAVQLRKGAPVPAPDKIGPDSYFFDPITQRPYKLYVSHSPTGAVYLHVRRTVAPYEDWDSSLQRRIKKTEMEVTRIYLPANHPGLQGVPPL